MTGAPSKRMSPIVKMRIVSFWMGITSVNPTVEMLMTVMDSACTKVWLPSDSQA